LLLIITFEPETPQVIQSMKRLTS